MSQNLVQLKYLKAKVKVKKQLPAVRHKEKELEYQVENEAGREYTHRLCARGGMPEPVLREPGVLWEKDVMELLTVLARRCSRMVWGRVLSSVWRASKRG